MSESHVRKGIKYGSGIGLGFGLFLSGMIACGNAALPAPTPQEVATDIDEANQEIGAATLHNEQTLIKIGETCVSALNPYRSDGILADSSEDLVVSDLLAETNQPCGPTPSQVRQNVRTLLGADDRLESAENSLYWAEDRQDIAEEPFTQENALTAVGVTTIIGLTIGTGMGIRDRRYYADGAPY